MENSFEINTLDNNNNQIIGEKAVQNYYSHYKRLDKIMQ